MKVIRIRDIPKEYLPNSTPMAGLTYLPNYTIEVCSNRIGDRIPPCLTPQWRVVMSDFPISQKLHSDYLIIRMVRYAQWTSLTISLINKALVTKADLVTYLDSHCPVHTCWYSRCFTSKVIHWCPDYIPCLIQTASIMCLNSNYNAPA